MNGGTIMGVNVMLQSDELKELVKQYGTVRKCMCGGYAIPTSKTFYEDYENFTLELHNFPVFKCDNCQDITYNPNDHVRYRRLALEQYMSKNNKVFNCSAE